MNSIIDKVIKVKLRRLKYYNKFCELAIERGGEVLSDVCDYKTAHSLLDIKCDKTHIFSITLSNLNNERWCSYCNFHQNELYTRYIMEYIFNKKFIKIRPTWLLNEESNRLEVDIYNEELNLAVEYNGIQHYEYIHFFHRTEENFKKSQNHDNLKKIKLKEKGINYIVIPYNITNIYSFILEKLDELNIKYKVPENEPNKFDIFMYNNKMQEILDIIKLKKGQYIKGQYITGKSPIKIQCYHGHEWNTKMKNILDGFWCTICSRKKSEYTKNKISETRKNKIKNGEIKKPPIKKKQIRKYITNKKCTKCNIILDIENFCKKKDTADGFQPYCKNCINIIKNKLRDIERKNKDNNLYICTICKKEYKLQDSLWRHIKEKHKNIKNKK